MLTRRARKGAVPVVVLAGFLGAGKTTILNHILGAAAGARVAVIVNDFGAINIDSLLIASQTDRRLELTNGCICCRVDGGELEEAFEAALELRPDVIVIEASGLAEPEDLARLVARSPNSKVGYGGMVYVVDAVNYRETVQRHRRVAEHVTLADLVVIAKCEQVTSQALEALVAELRKKTKGPIVPVERGELAPQLIFDIPERPDIQLSLLQQSRHHYDHLHDGYQQATFEATEPIAPERLREFMNRQPQGVYRIKGIVYFGVAGYEQKFMLQSVGGKWDMYAEEWGDGEEPRTRLVLVGAGLDGVAAVDRLHGTIGESSQMIDIQRYTS